METNSEWFKQLMKHINAKQCKQTQNFTFLTGKKLYELKHNGVKFIFSEAEIEPIDFNPKKDLLYIYAFGELARLKQVITHEFTDFIYPVMNHIVKKIQEHESEYILNKKWSID